MESYLLILLYIFIFLFVFNYFIYPLFIIFLSKLFKDKHLDKIKKTLDCPDVSFIIAAYNEEKVIAKKILNSLSFDYPKNKINIIVVTDGSDDNTASIVRRFSNDNVICLHDPQRNGKSAALNHAVSVTNSDVLVFSDANNDFSEDAIKHLVKHFSDEDVGAVTGAKHIYSNSERQSAQGDGLYWKYESKIKKAESHLGSITGAEGEILAVRRSCFKKIDPSLINDDAAITFDIVKSGKRILYEENAKAFEEASIDLIDDYHVKVRMTSGGYQTVSRELLYLFPPRSWFAFTFISHKVLRWLAPHLMIFIFILSAILSYRLEGMILLVIQLIFYSVSCYGWYNRKSNLPTYIYIPMYFSSMNFALFMGFLKFLNKRQTVQWKKAER